ncbi:SRPBCC domain-containing protein [Paraburkholderia solisilvae]|uniref:Carbon monoxide dehydrogenase subunit G n=1 Tax=Paraburkholderia solisilvae TaxID=624376 RepID=A0A6J5D1E7_9BURK|nr:SRPBCC domain-containing protein [Paraburkholderia solisilvae]CAB3746506.1 hypothetical protein LMG29739_00201 [Paraburkholderia solisilvae]
MEIEQSFTVAYPLDDVWASFHDTSGIVACLPGASLTAPPDNGALKLAMTVKLGPIVASFAGDGAITLDENSRCGSVSGGGVDRKSASRVKGVAGFALHATAPDETRVDVKVDYTIAGSLAQFSRGGIVKELATRLTEAFAQNLKTKLDTQSANAASALAPTPAPTAERQTSVPEARTEAQQIAPANADAAPTSAAAPAIASVDTPHTLNTPAPAATRATNDATPHTQPAVAASSPPTAPPAARVAQPANAPLDLGNLFWKMLWSRIRGWLRVRASSR